MATLCNTSDLSFLLLLGIIIVLTQLTSQSEASSNYYISTHAVLSPSAPPLHRSPSPAPAPAPASSPASAPQPALHPLAKPMERRFLAMQGVVYCKSCNYTGVNTLLGASPLPGSVVKLQCNNTNSYLPTSITAVTDKNGYFYLEAPRTVTSYAFHKCKAYLVSSPLASCSKPSLLHGGSTGAALRPEKPIMVQNLPFMLYIVGPFAFEPQCSH
ncbi:hypothetical protein MLD38_016748 [Melastoma candidum]|uniref:Uncharacterized protein n=1 Tax=Melastoma candidum TaxID=119954 RepID=A0ACB9QMS1_9MYRT|nr:hypothetical protein MLD38_016748 [Melastoma candidum]